MSDPETLQLLKHAVERLETLGIRYFITGSVAAMLVGKPRLTHDIDIVVALDRSDLPRLESAFPSPRFYFNDIAAKAALGQGGMFNVIEVDTGLKIDFIIPQRGPWTETQFRRALPQGFDVGHEGRFVSVEDLILNKLLFFREGGSEKHLRDIAGVLGVQGPKVDRQYIADWAERLEVQSVWQLVLDRESPKG